MSPACESSAVYERLLRGEATSEEYVAAVRAETSERLHQFQRDRAFWAASASRERQRLVAERDRLQRLFNRLEAAISHHKAACERNDVPDVHDEALWAARDRVLKDASEGRG